MRINPSIAKWCIFAGAILAVCLVVMNMSEGISSQEKEKVKIISAYTAFRESMIRSNMPAAFAFFTPAYKSERPVELFGEKFGFIRDKEYAVQPKSALSFRGPKAILIPWKGLGLVASGAGFEFEQIGTNWFLTGELTWYSD